MPTTEAVAERPPTPATPTLRAGRAAVFAALCVLVGAVGHDAFSVGAIPLWALLVGGVATFLVVRPLTRRERGLPVILTLMAAVQVGLHELFAGAQRAAGGAMSTPMAMGKSPARGLFWCGHTEPPGVTQVMHNVAMPAMPTMPQMPSMPGMASQHAMTTGMWLAHLAAALVAAWWLRRGEAAVWSLARTLGLALVTPLVLLPAVLVPWTPPRRAGGAPVVAGAERTGAGRFLRFELARRGPPMSVAAFV